MTSSPYTPFTNDTMPNGTLSLFAILLGFFLFTILLAILYALSNPVPWIGEHLTEIYAVAFLFLPHLYHSRTGFPIPDFGPLIRSLSVGILIMLVIGTLFTFSYYAYFHYRCDMQWNLWNLGRRCVAWHPFSLPSFRFISRLLFIHAIAVALPEEYFYRGFLQPLIITSKTLKRFSDRQRIAIGIVLQAFLFACGHALVDFNPLRFSVFFPGLLFGWAAHITRGLWAPIVLHTGANVLSETLEAGFFG